MRIARRTPTDSALSMRFILPVIGENLLTITIGLVFSQIISGISSSALAAIGMANTVQNFVFALFSMITTGASVLVARRIGEGRGVEAAGVVEQASFLSVAFSAAVAALCFLFASPILRLLMPGAEDALFGEAVAYFRILMLSLPFYALHSVLSAIFRAAGNGKTPMRIALIMNMAQLAAGFLFISVLHLEEIGAGLAYVLCRLVGAGLMLYSLLHYHTHFVVHLRGMLRFRADVCRHVLSIGAPNSIEAVFVQMGYMIANSMSIALGTFEAGVYQILNTFNTFVALPQNVTLVAALPIAGQLIGAGKPEEARRTGRKLWAAAIGATVVLCAFLMLFATPLVSIYSSDSATIASAASMTWLLLVLNVPAASINCIDPQLRAGGDGRQVMFNALGTVWLIRLPLTYLFCFVWDMGVSGIFLGNTAALVVRASFSFARHCGSKWLVHKV